MSIFDIDNLTCTFKKVSYTHKTMADKDTLKSIKELVEIIKNKVERVETTQMGNSASIRLTRDQLSVVNEKLDKVTKRLDDINEEQQSAKKQLNEVKDVQEKRILPPVIYIETTVKSYADRYVTNEDHIRRLDKRLNTVEEDLGIQPPQDLSIPPVE